MLKFINIIVICVLIGVLNLINADSQNIAETCTTPINVTGECIPLNECNSLFSLLKGSPRQGNRTFLTRSQCGYRDNQPLVCCPDSVPIENPLLPKPMECGFFPMDRIIGGIEASVDGYPWMALLEYSKPNYLKEFHCVGTLINKRYVLTAAHCVKGLPAESILTGVRLGEHNLLTEPDCEEWSPGVFDCNEPVIKVPIIETVVHELYDPESKDQTNDISLLRLHNDVTYSDFIRPICLPQDLKQRKASYDDGRLEVVGWNSEISPYSTKLRGFVDGINNTRCNQLFHEYAVSVQSSQFCVANLHPHNFDPCHGIPGSPVMTIRNSVSGPYYYLDGVSLFSPVPCGPTNWTGLYTRIDSYINWINSKLY